MGYKQRRKIVRFGSFSKGIVLPKGWIEFHNLKTGDYLTVLGDSVLIISHPMHEARAHAVLEHLERGALQMSGEEITTAPESKIQVRD